MNDMTAETPREAKDRAVVPFRQQLEDMAGQFKAALPAHIPVERFARVVMTAIQQTPELLACERRSLWNAALKAAQDGLLPDGREAAMVIYNDKERGKIVQYMPMIAGIRKKVRNSGEIATWDVYVVHANDEFAYELGDEPFIKHRPILDGDPGKVIAAYSVATLKSGEKSREVMTVAAIEKVRAVSRAKDSKFGPWVNWYEEMCRKTVARRHSKSLPMSTDLDDLIRQDDALYDFDGAREEAADTRPKSLASKLDMLASGSGRDVVDEDGVIQDQNGAGDSQAPGAEGAAGTAAGQQPASGGSSPARTKKASAPKPKDAEKGPSDGLAGSESKPVTDAQGEKDASPLPGDPSPEPGPVISAPTAAGEQDKPAAPQPSSSPAVTHEPQEPLRLTKDERAKLKVLADALSGAMSESGLQRGSSRFYSDNEVEEGTVIEAAAARIFSAHMERVHGRLSPVEADHIVRKVLAP